MTIPDSILNNLSAELKIPNIVPGTNNYLTTNKFLFYLRRCPRLTHFCQRVNIPSIGFGESMQSNPTGIEIRRPGTRYIIDNLTVGFLVEENFKNWLEIFNWLKGIGIYSGVKEDLRESDKVSTASIHILNSSYNPILRVDCYNIFPVSLSGINFETSAQDAEPVLADATFAFTHYEIFDLSGSPAGSTGSVGE